ncbi:unnamed protein product, partial [Brassica rapa subsp. narinosa]
LWAVKNVISHKLNWIIFVLNDECTVRVVTRLNQVALVQISSFRGWGSITRDGMEWRVEKEDNVINRVADLIAQSVTKQHQYQSLMWLCRIGFWFHWWPCYLF